MRKDTDRKNNLYIGSSERVRGKANREASASGVEACRVNG